MVTPVCARPRTPARGTTAGTTTTTVADRPRSLACGFVPSSDRILMGPGPCNPYPEVVEALVRPMLGHLDPEFVALLDETCARLREVFRTTNPLPLPISGTG